MELLPKFLERPEFAAITVLFHRHGEQHPVLAPPFRRVQPPLSWERLGAEISQHLFPLGAAEKFAPDHLLAGLGGVLEDWPAGVGGRLRPNGLWTARGRRRPGRKHLLHDALALRKHIFQRAKWLRANVAAHILGQDHLKGRLDVVDDLLGVTVRKNQAGDIGAPNSEATVLPRLYVDDDLEADSF